MVFHFQVTIAYVCDPHNFYVHVMDESETLIYVMKNLKTLGDDPVPTTVSCGDTVAAQFTDGAWYRANVEKVIPIFVHAI